MKPFTWASGFPLPIAHVSMGPNLMANFEDKTRRNAHQSKTEASRKARADANAMEFVSDSYNS